MQTALRVWDAFLCEGTNVLFRTALALLRMKEKELMQLADAALIHQLLFAYPKSVHDADVVMQVRSSSSFPQQGPSLSFQIKTDFPDGFRGPGPVVFRLFLPNASHQNTSGSKEKPPTDHFDPRAPKDPSRITQIFRR